MTDNKTTKSLNDFDDVKKEAHSEIDKSIKEKETLLSELEKGIKDLNEKSPLYLPLHNQLKTLKTEIKELEYRKKKINTIFSEAEKIDTFIDYKKYRNKLNIKLVIRGVIMIGIFLLLVTKYLRKKILSLFLIKKSDYLYLAMVFIFISYLLIHLF